MHCIITIKDQLCFERFDALMTRLQQIINAHSDGGDGPVPDNAEIHLYYIPGKYLDAIIAAIDKFLMKENILADLDFLEEDVDDNWDDDRIAKFCGPGV